MDKSINLFCFILIKFSNSGMFVTPSSPHTNTSGLDVTMIIFSVLFYFSFIFLFFLPCHAFSRKFIWREIFTIVRHASMFYLLLFFITFSILNSKDVYCLLFYKLVFFTFHIDYFLKVMLKFLRVHPLSLTLLMTMIFFSKFKNNEKM